MAFGDLTTFEAVQKWLEVNQGQLPSSDWDLARDLITEVSDYIHAWLNRFIPVADYEEIRDGTGGAVLIFANFPVISVASVNVDTIEILPAATVITPGYSFNDAAVAIRGRPFTRGMQNVVLRYTAGYAQIPRAIAQACTELVGQRYRERARVGVKQETIVGVDSYTYVTPAMIDSVETTLLQYRSVVPISTFSRRLAPTQTYPAVIAAVL